MSRAQQLIDEAVASINEAPADAKAIYAKFEKTRDQLYKYVDQLSKLGDDTATAPWNPSGVGHRMYDDLSGLQVTVRSKLKLKR